MLHARGLTRRRCQLSACLLSLLTATGSSLSNYTSGVLDLAAVGRLLKPQYHITAPTGWINDPCGPLYYNGLYHIFFQWNSLAPVWGKPDWGHAASRDLVHWLALEPALVKGAGGTGYDADGVFSGSSFAEGNSPPQLFYTGVSNYSQLGYFYQVQATARPANLSDPLLRHWVKDGRNPLTFPLPPGGTPAQFRDPSVLGKSGSSYYSIIGAQTACAGTAALYSSPDLRNWTYTGPFGGQTSLGEAQGTCPLAKPPQPGMGLCDQYSASCHTWECPDLATFNSAAVLKWSDQVRGRNPFSADWYLLADPAPEGEDYGSLEVQSGPKGVFNGTFSGGGNSTARRLDFGSVYASRFFSASDERSLWIGWIFETLSGCVEQCAKGTPATEAFGYQGAETLPRVVTYDADSQSLLFNPVGELASLRNILLTSMEYAEQDSNGKVLLPLGNTTSPSKGRQLELSAAFRIYARPGYQDLTAIQFDVGAVLSTSANDSTYIGVNGTLDIAAQGSVLIKEAFVMVDRTASGGLTNQTIEGGPIVLPEAGLAVSDIEIRAFVDHSIIELYVLGGRAVVTSRIYPTNLTSPWGVKLVGGVEAERSDDSQTFVRADLWELDSCWVNDLHVDQP